MRAKWVIPGLVAALGAAWQTLPAAAQKAAPGSVRTPPTAVQSPGEAQDRWLDQMAPGLVPRAKHPPGSREVILAP